MTSKNSKNTTADSARRELREFKHNQNKLHAVESGLSLNCESLKSDCERLKAKVIFIEACLAELTPSHRETIELVFFKKLKYRELQRLFGLSKSGAEKRVRNAVKAFATLFDTKVR